jgi:hypothetical protein
VQGTHQVPNLGNLRLDRCHGTQQDVFGARAEVKHEVPQVVGLIFSRAELATPASFVGFIEDHSSVPTIEEVSALFRIVEDQSRGDDGDAEGAARDVLGTRVLMM